MPARQVVKNAPIRAAHLVDELIKTFDSTAARAQSLGIDPTEWANELKRLRNDIDATIDSSLYGEGC